MNIIDLLPYIDYIQLMGLDYTGSTWGSLTGAHQNLYGGELNSDSIIQQLITSGVSSSKIILECPMYARPSGQPSTSGTELNYNDSQLINFETNYTFYNSDKVNQETIDTNGVLFTYDSIESITDKVNYVNNNIKGISFWKISGDRTIGSLVSVTNTLLKDSSLNNLSYPTSIYTNIKNPSLA